MKQEEKDLLIKDLCARLPYGVKIETPTDCWTSEKGVCELKEIFKGDDELFRIDNIGALIEYSKPYLFPMSSMTVKQRDSYRFLASSAYTSPVKLIDFFHKNHIDYRGLIEKGLAIDATNLNIY